MGSTKDQKITVRHELDCEYSGSFALHKRIDDNTVFGVREIRFQDGRRGCFLNISRTDNEEEIRVEAISKPEKNCQGGEGVTVPEGIWKASSLKDSLFVFEPKNGSEASFMRLDDEPGVRAPGWIFHLFGRYDPKFFNY